MSVSLRHILRGLSIALGILVILVYVGYALVYVSYAIDLFRWPFDYDQGEGFELYDAVLYGQGEWPYRDNSVYPFYASNYPPLFHLLILPLLPVFGPRLIAGRLVSFAATLTTATTISVVVRRRVGGRLIPAISGLSFLASNYVYQIGPLSRMHMTMVMFETLAVAFIADYDHPRHGRRNLVVALVMLLCAGYTKQMAVFTIAAALAYVFLRDVKKAAISGLVLAAVAGLIFWLLNVVTNGQWWINIIQANVNEFDYLQTIFLFGQWFRLHTLFVVLAGALLAYELFWGRLSVYSLWFFFSLGAGALSGKWGAGFGYFTTAISAICLSSGLALGRLIQTGRRLHDPDDSAPSGGLSGPIQMVRGRVEHLTSRLFRGQDSIATALLALLIPTVCLIQAPRMLHLPTSGPIFGQLAKMLGVSESVIEGDCTSFQYHDTMGYTQLGHLLSPEDYEAGEEILNYVRTSDGPVLSEEAMFSLLAGEPVVTNPTQLLNLYNNNLLDTTEIVERINQQEFGVVIFRAQFYPPPVLEAIGQNYKPVDHICMNGFTYRILWPSRVLQTYS